ncbi:MAG: GTPase Era [Oligoflexia bacterium]|nr:GTPase Era [Oligoflexia bacterium]
MRNFRSGYITIIGVPNAGKSSLVNALVKESVSIVTAKPQTTRKRTLGILTQPNQFQMVFVDTPGIIDSDAGLNPFLKQELQASLGHVDVVIAAIAPWEFNKEEKPWAVQIAQGINKPVIYIATQSDKYVTADMINKRDTLWPQWIPSAPLKLISSVREQGLEELKDLIYSHLPEGPQYYDTDIFTPQSMRELAAETIRKHCFEQLHQEIPYGLAVVLRSFEEKKLFKIEADIMLSKDSHKGMVIGAGGQTLKQIGTRARYELEKIFGHKIFLKLHVIVKPQWLKDRNWLEELGYVATK